MTKLLERLDSFSRVLSKVLYGAALITFSIFVVLIIYQVISRNIRSVPVIQWTEEISRFSFMWMIMIGATIGALHSDHFVIEIFERNTRAGLWTTWIRELSVLIVALVFVFNGFEFGLSGARRISMAAGLPMYYVYMSFFVMGVLVTIFSAQRILILVLRGAAALDAFDHAGSVVSAGPQPDFLDETRHESNISKEE